MKLATATIGVLMLGACDFGAREQAELRHELAAKDLALANQQREVARLTAELASEREQRGREAAAHAQLVDPLADASLVVHMEAEPGPPVDLSFPKRSPPDAMGIACAANRCTVPRATIDALLADRAKLAMQVNVVPSIKNDEPRGLRLYGIRNGSVVQTIGLENGDRVTAIGGHPLGGFDEAIAAFAAIKRQPEWKIAGERKHAPFELTLVIVD